MATPPAPQRAYRAACPNCGAPVEFASSASAFAVCGFCRSTLVRDGEALRRTGESAELFDDHSPLQLGASGRSQGSAFTLVGRLQYRYKDGSWNEWHALFDTGRSGWLSEDNGRYVLGFERPLSGPAPGAAELTAGASQRIDGQAWAVGSVTVARLHAAWGELPHAPQLERAFVVADLRSPRGDVGTLDYSDAAKPAWSVGQAVSLTDLAMTGLAEASEKTLSARGVQCPSCGAALEVQLATTQSITCHQCHAVVDVSQGVGGDLQHYAQATGSAPQIALGSVGLLTLGSPKTLHWQVVGYAERCELPASADDEQEFWREYLLYHRTEGFAFLIDANDGWSWSVPLTGVPTAEGANMRHKGVTYRKLYSYTGRVVYVVGEFYWRLARDETTLNTDYQGTGGASSKRLNREQTGAGESTEVTWSAGDTLPADTVIKAFKLAPDQGQALQRDASPTTLGSHSIRNIIIVVAVMLVLMSLLSRCGGSGPDCNSLRSTFGEASLEYRNCLDRARSSGRTGGGAFGGYSSGGGHK